MEAAIKSNDKVFEGLPDRMRVFCIEYAVDLDGKRAAIEAGYKSPAVMANRLLKNDKVKSAISKLVEPAIIEAQLDATNILTQLQRFAFHNVVPYLDSEGNLRVPPNELPEDIQQCITGIDTTHNYDKDGNLLGTKFKIQLVNKLTAVFKAMDYLKLTAPQEHIHKFDWESFYNSGKTTEPSVIETTMKELDGTPIPSIEGTNGKA